MLGVNLDFDKLGGVSVTFVEASVSWIRVVDSVPTVQSHRILRVLDVHNMFGVVAADAKLYIDVVFAFVALQVAQI